jgi:hypothetical protein
MIEVLTYACPRYPASKVLNVTKIWCKLIHEPFLHKYIFYIIFLIRANITSVTSIAVIMINTDQNKISFTIFSINSKHQNE